MEKKPIGLEIPANLSPIYANLVRISHSPADLVIDFAHILPGESVGKVNARIVMSPLSAKLLLLALSEHMANFERVFGEIHPPSATLAEQLFNKINKNNDPEKGSEGDDPNGSA